MPNLSRRAPGHDPDAPPNALGATPLRAGMLLILAALMLGACGATSTPSPSASAPSSPAASIGSSSEPSAPASAGPSPAASPSPPAPSPTIGQTDTEWGRIWDAVPASFPVYPGGTMVEPDEPASLAYEVDVDVARVTTDLQAELETAGLSTFALSGPFEDGSMVIDSTGDPPGCDARTTIAPLGTTTRVTVLYGVGCPSG